MYFPSTLTSLGLGLRSIKKTIFICKSRDHCISPFPKVSTNILCLNEAWCVAEGLSGRDVHVGPWEPGSDLEGLGQGLHFRLLGDAAAVGADLIRSRGLA